MGYRLRQFDAESKFSSELHLEAIGRAVPMAAIKASLQATGVQEVRERKLNMVTVMLLTIAMNIFTRLSIGAVMRKMARGLRFVWPDPDYAVPRDSAIAYRRYQLGARPMVDLFHRVCQPMATPETPGAFLFGLRLMAIDGTVEDAADTPANVAAFGRHVGNRGDSAFPQIQGVYLAECGTHAIVDAGFWPCDTSERVGGFRMLRSLEKGMLIMWDRGFHDFDMFAKAQKQGAEVLSRLPSNVKPQLARSWHGRCRMGPGWLIFALRSINVANEESASWFGLSSIPFWIQPCLDTVTVIAWSPLSWIQKPIRPWTWPAPITNDGKSRW